MDDREPSTSGGTASPTEASQGAKKVRRALKNARSLISELFQKEKFTGRTPPRRPQRPTSLEAGNPHVGGRMSGDSGRRSELVYETGEDDDDEDDDDGGIWDDITFGLNPNVARNAPKNALDTLSTMDDSDWDEVHGVNDLLRTFDDQAAMVQPGLFIGAFLAEQNREELERLGITHILQVGDNLTQSFEREFEYCTISVADTEKSCLLVFLQECFDFIEKAKESGGGVLVHCFAGISRSATICIAYLMWKRSLSLGAAHFMVESARPCTQPNDGFKVQLQTFESLGCDLGKLKQWIKEQGCNTQHLSSDDFDL